MNCSGGIGGRLEGTGVAEGFSEAAFFTFDLQRFLLRYCNCFALDLS